jgi:pimeloyl-ACP methyl ester carboxylesterase
MRRLCFIVILTCWIGEAIAGGVSEVSFLTADSVTIAATYYTPPAAPAPAVILMHMLGRSRQSWVEFADSLRSRGFAVLTFDFRGHGQSTQSARGKLVPDSLTNSDYQAMTRDASAAVSWLRQRTDILPEKIGLVGAGFGANLALAYAAKDIRIQAVALISPGQDYRGIILEGAIRQYSPRPLYLAYAEDDNYSAISLRDVSSLAAGPKIVDVYPVGGHGMYLLGNAPGLTTNIVSFFAAQLR